MKYLALLFLTLLVTLNACKTKRSAQRNTSTLIRRLDTINIVPQNGVAKYNASAKRLIDITHMDLSVDFDYAQQTMHGVAILTLHPYYYATDSIVLEAKSMDINTIKINTNSKTAFKNYTYINDNLVIYLTKIITATDTISVSIDYRANPERIKKESGKAITADKGLYFINPLRTDSTKPRQVWTQGETEAASCWFPTVNATNEKFTHDLHIFVDANDITLSNGVLVSSSYLESLNKRCDDWKMIQPNAPYLVMLAVGEFEVVKQKWRGKEVSYYLEKKYAPLAQQNFGDTPEMLEYFSNLLGVEYPWANYKQVVAHDYVSGAMENTTATLHGEFMNKTAAQAIDAHPFDYYHDVVAHELFHQWFGDLVTCESWSNLPLNESFASYGEYLWIEHKYGTQAADDHLRKQLTEYLYEAQTKQVPLIRYDYDQPDDMFDAHSYQKGSRILHMLRKYVGDAAFFKSLQVYLTQNKMKSAEVANLRMAFEEVTGEDLNWFFNQWFFNAGHPVLSYNYTFDEAHKELKIAVNQLQQNDGNSVIYQLPTTLTVWGANNAVTTHTIVINKIDQTFTLPCTTPPALVLLDANHDLLAQLIDTLKNIEQLEYLQKHATTYGQKHTALAGTSAQQNNYRARNVLRQLCNDDYWGMQIEALAKIDFKEEYKQEFATTIKNIARTHTTVLVRGAALDMLLDESFKNDTDVNELMKKILANDSSITNKGIALNYILNSNDKVANTGLIKQYENNDDGNTIIALARYYAKNAEANKFNFYKQAINKTKKRDLFYVLAYYTQYTNALHDVNEYVTTCTYLTKQAQEKEMPDWAKNYVYYYIKDLINDNSEQLKLAIKANDNDQKEKRQEVSLTLKAMLNGALANESNEVKKNVENYK